MYKNRSNRPKKDLPSTQGYTLAGSGPGIPLNNHEPRVGVAKWKRRRKCHCKENCGGHKNKTISEQEKHWTKWNYD